MSEIIFKDEVIYTPGGVWDGVFKLIARDREDMNKSVGLNKYDIKDALSILEEKTKLFLDNKDYGEAYKMLVRTYAQINYNFYGKPESYIYTEILNFRSEEL